MGLKPRKQTAAKTVPTGADARAFADGVADARRRDESQVLLDLMADISGEAPTMWGSSIVGFGDYHYRYESGREGDFFRVGFSPRKTALTVYCMPGFTRYADLMGELGTYKTGASCLYIKRLDDVNMDVLRELLSRAYVDIKEIHPD